MNNINIYTNTVFAKKKEFYEEICQCYSQCINIQSLNESIDKQLPIHLINKQSICNKIEIREHIDYNNLLQSCITYLKNNFLEKIGNKYYIKLNNKIKTIKFTWDNIKSLNKEYHSLKELFWLIRKFIVDTLLKKIIIDKSSISNDYKDIKIYSVGSTELTSDYDITLYHTNNEYISTIIDECETFFINTFGEHSSKIFDTNIYGKAYIQFHKNNNENFLKNYQSFNCTNVHEEFYYLKHNVDKYISTQVVWGIIKYFKNIRDSLGENIYTQYFQFLKNNVKNESSNKSSNKSNELTLFDKIQDTLIYLRNIDTSYSFLINSENIHEEYYNKNYNKLLFLNDFISLVNFYGEETYYTRGAFLDTVVNNQMCKNNESIILTQEDYIASILENAGFFFIHNEKNKYLSRVKDSIINLVNINTQFNSIQKSHEFKKIKNIGNKNYKYCNWIGKYTFNLKKCEKYDVFQYIFKIIYKILQIYLKDKIIYFPFYDIYIRDNIGEINSPIEKNKPKLRR